ncbi:MAG: hypothetical protein ABIE23_01415, partial [archaeon]
AIYYIAFKKWNGSNWVDAALGQGRVSGVTLNEDRYGNASLDINSEGIPYIAWTEYVTFPPPSTWNIVLKKWNGSSWGKIHEIIEPEPGNFVVGPANFASSKPVLVLNSTELAVVAWDVLEGGQKNIACRYFNLSSCNFVPNEFPEISITSPVQGGGEFNALTQTVIDFDATITNTPAYEDCNYSWDSNIQGNLCTGTDCKNPSCITSLSTGHHEITLTATDSIGQPSSETIIGFIEPYEGQSFSVTEFNIIKLNPPNMFAIDGNIRVDVNVSYFQIGNTSTTLTLDLKDATTRKSIDPFPIFREIKFIDEDVNEFSEIISFGNIPDLKETSYIIKISIAPGMNEVTLSDNEVNQIIRIGPPIGTIYTTRAFLELPLYAIPVILGVILVLIYRKKIIPERFLPKRKEKPK